MKRSAFLLLALAAASAAAAPADGAWHGLDDKAALAAWRDNVRTNFALPTRGKYDRERMMPFLRALWSDAFDEPADATAADAAGTRALLEDFSRLACRGQLDEWPDENWRRVEAFVAGAGVRHPFLLWMAATGPVHWGRPDDGVSAFRALEEAAAAPDATPLARLLAAHAALLRETGSATLRKRRPSGKDLDPSVPKERPAPPERLDALRRAGAEWAATFAGRPEATRSVRGFLILLLPSEDPGMAGALEAAGADPWLVLLFRGHSEIAKAWEARGSGWAHTVSAEGWKEFSDHLALARVALERAWELRPDLPIAAAFLVTVSGGDAGDAEMDKWFGRACEAEIDFWYAYNQYFWFNYPRWHGSTDRMRRFAKALCAIDRDDLPLRGWGGFFLVRLRTELGVPSPVYWADDARFRMAERALSAAAADESNHLRTERETAALALAAIRWARGDRAGALETAKELRTPFRPYQFLSSNFEQWSEIETAIDGFGGPRDALLRRLFGLRFSGDPAACLAEADAAWETEGDALTDAEARLLSSIRFGAWRESAFTNGAARGFPIVQKRHVPDWGEIAWPGPDKAGLGIDIVGTLSSVLPGGTGTAVARFRHKLPWNVEFSGEMLPVGPTNAPHRISFCLSDSPTGLADRPVLVLERFPDSVGVRFENSATDRDRWGEAYRGSCPPGVPVRFRILFHDGRLLLWIGHRDAPSFFSNDRKGWYVHAARQGDATLFVVLENTRFGGIAVVKPDDEGVAFLDWWERKGAPCPWKR